MRAYVTMTKVPNTLDHLVFVSLYGIQNLIFLGYVEDEKKMGCGWVGGFMIENNATLWLHLASWNLPDFQLSWKSKMEPSVAKIGIFGKNL